MVPEVLVSDEGLTLLVQQELRRDRATAGLTVGVQVLDRVVILRGTVDELGDVPAAVAVVERVPGVAGVIERLQVEHLL